ncbi:MAG TPA: preprotein translocase subunit YajC [Spirochaetia bacterium]|nr:preprotein translocase subunit YajC [Spirochaetia bacterium]
MTGIMSLLPLLLGAPDGGAGASGGGGGTQLVTMLVTFGLIIVVFYFLVIRPQNRKQRDAKKMLESIRKGDRVVTVGGMHGFVESVKDDSVVLRIDDNVKVKFNRSAVSQVLERRDDSGDSKE